MRGLAPTPRSLVTALGLAACALPTHGGTAARADPVLYPKEDARVALDVPKDWSVDYTSFGLELAAPDRKSFVVAGIAKPGRKDIDAWAKEAGAKMRGYGLAIDPNAKAPKPKAVMPPMTVLNLPKDRNAFTFSGTPSLEIVPETGKAASGDGGPRDAGSNDAAPTINEVLRSVPAAGTPMPKIPFKSIQYVGASLEGKPFDLQLIIYKLGPTEAFLVEQTSGADDPRAAAIVTSAKILSAKVLK